MEMNTGANPETNANAGASTATNQNVNLNIAELETKTKEELVEMAKEKGIATPATLKKHDIIMRLLETHTEEQGNIFCSGILEIMADGYGFLRQETLLPSQTDVYISPSQIRRFGLRNGDMVTGQGRPPKSNEKYFSLLQVVAINNLLLGISTGNLIDFLQTSPKLWEQANQLRARFGHKPLRNL